MERMLFSVGYPIGPVQEDNRLVFFIGNQSKLLTVGPFEYYIWRYCLYGKEPKRLKQDFAKEFQEQTTEYDALVNRMINSGLVRIVDLDDDEAYFSAIIDLIPEKQGVGIGYVYDQKIYKVKLDQDYRLNKLQYTLWYLASGTKTVQELVDEYISTFHADKYTAAMNVMHTSYYLYNNGLILFSRKV